MLEEGREDLKRVRKGLDSRSVCMQRQLARIKTTQRSEGSAAGDRKILAAIAVGERKNDRQVANRIRDCEHPDGCVQQGHRCQGFTAASEPARDTAAG